MSDQVVFTALLKAKQQGQPVVLATIIRDQGAVPRHAGAKMLAGKDGLLAGTIGGGLMEQRILDAVPDLLKEGKPRIINIKLADPEQGDAGVCGGQVDIFVEPIMPDPTILIIGCGHCGQALAELAHWAGFRVQVTDDRADLCNAEVIPDADEYYPIQPHEIADKIPVHDHTYVAAVTRGVPFDVEMLPGLLKTPAPYIGVMGSRRRWTFAVKELRKKGVSDDELARIYAPIGLELNAETPREIAVSILAEIIAHQHSGTGYPMKWLSKPEEADTQ